MNDSAEAVYAIVSVPCRPTNHHGRHSVRANIFSNMLVFRRRIPKNPSGGVYSANGEIWASPGDGIPASAPVGVVDDLTRYITLPSERCIPMVPPVGNVN